jgi:glycosyltransferase involved in cell wall biosynthesis
MQAMAASTVDEGSEALETQTLEHHSLTAAAGPGQSQATRDNESAQRTAELGSTSSAAAATAEPARLVSVVIPTLNEAENLPHILPGLSLDYEVIIVDGGSNDGTTAVAEQLRPSARIIEQTRRGKGNALTCGFAAARGEIIVTLDADGSAKIDEIPRFVDALLAGADFAKGSRFLGDGGSADITRIRRLGNRSLSGLVNLLFGTRYTDLCYGYNAFWSRCLPYLRLDCDGFEVETQLNIRACKAGLVVVEVPSFEESRIHGVSNLHAIRDGSRVLRTILVERFGVRHRRPSLVLLPSDMGTQAEMGE